MTVNNHSYHSYLRHPIFMAFGYEGDDRFNPKHLLQVALRMLSETLDEDGRDVATNAQIDESTDKFNLAVQLIRVAEGNTEYE